MRLTFNADTELPDAPPHMRIMAIYYTNCPGDRLPLQVVKDEDRTFDSKGCALRSWWVVKSPNMPERTMRLDKGAHSLAELLRRYGFQGETDCVHHRELEIEYGPQSTELPAYTLQLCESLRDTCGVPQFYRRSGNCWFASLCWTTFANPCAAELVISRISCERVRDHCRRCLFDRDSAEAFRKYLWYTFQIGDNVEARPELDGRNGAAEFTAMCARLGVPLLRFEEKQGNIVPMGPVTTHCGTPLQLAAVDRSKSHLLMMRYMDVDNARMFPVHRRLVLSGVTYRLLGFYGGAKKCGHQTGIVFPTKSWRYCILGDADCQKDGIGPLHIMFDKSDFWKKNWWSAWRTIVLVTKYGRNFSEFCPLSPHNVPEDALDQYRGTNHTQSQPTASPCGTMTLDVLFLAEGGA